ncbi:MAG TPA: universal stress protein [Bifidobacteriaceae bacterium]|nr:universal stress protein [Bifidobacteriaceae bacterium]
MSDTTLNATESGMLADIRLHDIVVGVDGSDESFAALRWALNEASLTGQQVNAVFAWSHSWDMGSEPEDEEQWAEVRHEIAQRLRDWVSKASQGMTINEDHVKLTSVKATGTSALLEIGKDAQQIVVGRRSLGRVARWFLGSLSESLAEAAQVPVTIVRILDDEESSVQDAIANALTPSENTVTYDLPGSPLPKNQRPIVVGVDGSETSRHALRFAIDLAALHHAPLQVMFCWQLKDLGVIEGYENAIAPIAVGQERAERILDELLDSVEIPTAGIPDDFQIKSHAFHISAAKGLIAASRYARHLVVGSRGLSGLDAHFFGSVSKQIVNFADCTVTVVH